MKTDCTIKPLRRPRSLTTLRLRALVEEQQKIEIGQRLKSLRDASPHTNASIADRVGVGERAVANWMAGSTGIQWANVKKLADLFGVDVNWLWTGSEHRPGPTPDLLTRPAKDADLAAALQDLRVGQAKILAEISKLSHQIERQQSPDTSTAQPQKASGNH